MAKDDVKVVTTATAPMNANGTVSIVAMLYVYSKGKGYNGCVTIFPVEFNEETEELTRTHSTNTVEGWEGDYTAEGVPSCIVKHPHKTLKAMFKDEKLKAERFVYIPSNRPSELSDSNGAVLVGTFVRRPK